MIHSARWKSARSIWDRLCQSGRNKGDDSGMTPEEIKYNNRNGNLCHYLGRFRYSDYVRNLIRDYGLRMTFQFLASGPTEQFMLADIVDRADMLGCITRDEDGRVGNPSDRKRVSVNTIGV